MKRGLSGSPTESSRIESTQLCSTSAATKWWAVKAMIA
jgi:hypothetical protein